MLMASIFALGSNILIFFFCCFFLIAFLINVGFLPLPHRFLSLDPKLLEEEVLTAPC